MATPAEHAESLEQSDPAASADQKPALIEWLIGCSLTGVVLAVSATFAPAPLKKLGLFFLVLGGVMGWVTRLIGHECRVFSPVVLRSVGVLFGLAVLLNYSWLSMRALQHEAQAAFQGSAEAKLAQSFAEQPGADPTIRESFRKRYQPGFADYLAMRVSQSGHWPAPWPAIVFGLEILAGTVCAGWAAGRTAGRT